MPELGDRSAVAGGEPVQLSDSWYRHRFFEGLARAVLAAGRPTVLLLDDLHWCDLDTLTWLELCLHLCRDVPLLIVTTVRSEEVHDNADVVAALGRLRASGTVVDVELGPLDEAETVELAVRLVGPGHHLPSAGRLQALTGGFPLFVVEAARGRADERGAASDALGSRAQAVLAGRFDQLSPRAMELAGFAAAIGRDFSLELLTEASDLDGDAVVDALDELWRRLIVREHSATTYDFSHDLLRSAAYETLSPPQGRHRHRRVAQALELQHAGAIESVAAQIADQYDRAGLVAKAVAFYERAADAAARVFAHREAVRLAERAITLVAELPATRERDAQELRIRLASAGPRNALGGWASSGVRDNLEHLLDLSERSDDRGVMVVSLVGLFANCFVRGRLAEGRALAERALAAGGDRAELSAYGHFAMGGSLTSAGDPGQALAHFGIATSSETWPGFEVLGFPPGLFAWAWSAHACWLTGQVDEARRRAVTAIDVADDLAIPFGRAIAVAYAAITHQLRGDRDETLARAREVQELCARYEVAYYQHWGEVLEGWTRGGDEGATLIAEAIRRLRARDVGSRLPYYLAILAETLIGARRPEEAATALAEARQLAERNTDTWWLPELWRLEARLHPGAEGDAHLERALAIAGEHGSASLALRAACDLAERLGERGELARARDLVTPLRAGCVGTSPELEAVDARLDDLVGA